MKNKECRIEDCSTWDWYLEQGISKKDFYAALDWIHEDGRWRDFQPLDGHTLRVLCEWQNRSCILSGKHEKWRWTITAWLQMYGLSIPLVDLPSDQTHIPQAQKSEFEWDVLVDDSPAVALQAAEWAGDRDAGHVILIDWPWNRDAQSVIEERFRPFACPNVTVAHNWLEVEKQLKRLKRRTR